MSWKKNLRTPSFRGVEFNLWNSENEGGRNISVHEFVGREIPYAEDTSRIARTFSFDAFLSGENYFGQRNSLIQALETPGPGTLVHPYYGEMEVNVTRYRIREAGLEGNIVRFSIDFVEAGSLEYPTVSEFKGGFFSTVSDSADANAKAGFEKKFNVLKYPAFVADKATEKVNKFANALGSLLSPVDRTLDNASQFFASIDDLVEDSDQLITTPGKLADKLLDPLFFLADSIPNKLDRFKAYKSLFGFGDDDSDFGAATPSRVQVGNNDEALNSYIRVVNVTRATSAALEIPYESEDQAKDIRDQLNAEIDALSELDIGDDLYTNLIDLRTLIVKNIPPEGQDLPNIFDYKNTGTIPAIVLSYRIFADVESESDIILRNGVKNPNFVPGGTVLRILNRV